MNSRARPARPAPALHFGGATIGLAALALLAAAAPLAAAPTNQLTETPLLSASEAAHLRRGLAYLERGEYENANLEFEAVLRRDALPPTPHQRAEIYATAARAALAGRRFQASGYALIGFGNYAENSTIAGAAQTNDLFFSGRAGLRGNLLLSPSDTLNINLDYRFRAYDDGGRANDSDLRWDASLSHEAGDINVAAGVRGRASYRGNGQVRHDYGLFTEIRFLGDPDNQFLFGAELRRRDYPEGPLRDRSRNIVEFSGGWTRALFDGRASFGLVAGGGIETATQGRPDGDSLFVNVSPSLNVSFNDRWGGYAFVWWQNAAYSIEQIGSDAADKAAYLASRNDDLVEIGAGLTFEFGRGWSLNPELLWIRDFSNIIAVNYSSTELHLTLRKDF